MECWKYSYDYNQLQIDKMLALDNPYTVKGINQTKLYI